MAWRTFLTHSSMMPRFCTVAAMSRKAISSAPSFS